MDRYAYDYGDFGTAGDSQAALHLHCEVAGGRRPPIEAIPAIGYRVGVDLNVIDVRDDDEVAWLRALVWPEHANRAANLLAAVEVARSDPPPLVEGDGIERLGELIEGAPEDQAVCVIHTFVLNQVPPESRVTFYETLAQYSWRRPVFEVTMFGAEPGSLGARIELGRSVRGEWRRAVLARAHPHGQRMEWLL